MTGYRRIRLGRQGTNLEQCIAEGFAGLDYDLHHDLTGQFPEDWRDFNKNFIPVLLEADSERSKISAGIGCGAIWGFCHSMAEGDGLLAPDSDGNFHVGRITGPYVYAPEGPLPHRRPVDWTGQVLHKALFSQEFQRSTNGPLSLVFVDNYADEIEALLSGGQPPEISVADPDVEDPSVFALERHLEDFLVANWASTHFGKTHDLWKEDGEIIGQQFPSDTGPIDLLAVSKDGNEILVIELKRGRASDAVVGQIQRYMGYVQDELADDNHAVRGVIIALNDDLRLRRALSVATNIDFFRYKINFQLEQQSN